jgi:hypothetical protein
MARHVLFMDEPFHQLMLAQQLDYLLQYFLQTFLHFGWFCFQHAVVPLALGYQWSAKTARLARVTDKADR